LAPRRHAPAYLRGVSSAPTPFNFVPENSSAEALGVVIPEGLRAAADEVFE